MGNDEKDESKSSLSQLWDKIKEIKKVIEEKIDEISNRMTGLVAGFCTVLKDSLTQFPECLAAGKERILTILKSVSDHLHNIISRLIEGMFKFLTHVNSMAKTEGYAISKV